MELADVNRGDSVSARKNSRKEILITIHGVNPNRVWQDQIRLVFAPHFQCENYYYTDYDGFLGPLRAIANLPILAITIVLVIVSAIMSAYSWQIAFFIFVVAIVSFSISFILGWRKRIACVERLKIEIEDKCPLSAPHVVAHSLGTYLVGSVLRKFPDVRLNNVVLVSALLPRNFPWKSILEQRPNSVRAVRNEFGPGDIVVKTAKWIKWITLDLGNAGSRGFIDLTTWIHTVTSPVTACVLCAGKTAPVHNVALGGFGHSDVFLGQRHARVLWLPFLWGIGIDEFGDYLAACSNIAMNERSSRFMDASAIVDKLWETEFSWAGGVKLGSFVEALVANRASRGPGLSTTQIDEIIRETKCRFYLMTDEAIAESEINGSLDEEVARALHPSIAIGRVVNQLVAENE